MSGDERKGVVAARGPEQRVIDGGPLCEVLEAPGQMLGFAM